MKKELQWIKTERKFFITVIVLSFCIGVLCGYVHVYANDIYLVTNQYRTDLKLLNKRNSFKYQKKSELSICKKSGLFSDNWSNVVDDELAQLPDKLLDEFENSSWNIIVTSNDIATTYGDNQDEKGTVLGITIYNQEKIYIQLNKQAIKEATLHEFGHWLDDHYDDLAKKDEFEKIYQDEKGEFKRHLYDCNGFGENEMFAEGFYRYYKDSANLKSYCPETWDYMNTLILAYQ